MAQLVGVEARNAEPDSRVGQRSPFERLRPHHGASASGEQQVFGRPAGGTITTLDAFSDAILSAEQFYVSPAELTFVAAPATLGNLLKLKEGTGSAKPLISPDVTQPSRRTVGGVPIVASPAVAAGVVWCLPRPRIVVGLRKDAELKVDASAFFSSDRIGIRVVMRLGWGFVHNAAITKITVS